MIAKNNDENDQKTMIQLIISDPSVFSRVRPILRAEYFDKKFQPTIDYLVRFSDEFNTLPLIEQLNNEARIEYSLVDHIKDNPNVQNSILTMYESFAKRRALELAIEDAYSRIAKGETSGIDQIIKEAQMVSIKKDFGINFWENPEEWLTKIEEELGLLPTGWKSIDELMNGGFGWGQLNYIVAPANMGKSLVCQNLAVNWSIMGYNVLFFTLEMDKELVGKRLASMAMNYAYRDIRNNIKSLSDSIIFKRKSIKPGILQVIDMPIGCNSTDIEAFIQSFEIAKNIIPEIIIIDYADIMTPCDRRIDPNNVNLRDKNISLELRNIARERTHNGKKTMVLTASQITKDAMAEMEYTLSNIAGGAPKSHNADNIFSVQTNDSMRQRGEYEFKIMKARNAGCKDKKIKMKYNVDTLLISDMDNVQVQNPLSNMNQNISGALATLQGLAHQ